MLLLIFADAAATLLLFLLMPCFTPCHYSYAMPPMPDICCRAAIFCRHMLLIRLPSLFSLSMLLADAMLRHAMLLLIYFADAAAADVAAFRRCCYV